MAGLSPAVMKELQESTVRQQALITAFIMNVKSNPALSQQMREQAHKELNTFFDSMVNGVLDGR